MVVAVVATFLCCAWRLWMSVPVFDDDEVVLFVAPVLAVPVLVWLVLVIVAGAKKYAKWWRWGLLVPVFIIATIVLSGLYVPGRIGWLMTRGEMDRAAAQCAVLESGRFGVPYRSETIGNYEFHHIIGGPRGDCKFSLARYYPGATSGFMYLPDGRTPTSTIDTRYVPLGGYWYYFR
ncbi:hypothetical protein [Nocardia sp. AG03]|uniref:hypothetical protein n=1 Tax=Nocardia sp. AG03 TaxID=3025312 RepID=UPI0024189334|nr:hypothetical protein [Nocardia sp. AG03]